MRIKKGLVTSTKMDKTAVVTVQSYKSHPKFKKRYLSTKKFYVDDPKNLLKEGQEVTIQEVKPISKLKRWVVVDEQSIGSKSKEKESAKKVEEVEEKKEEKEVK